MALGRWLRGRRLGIVAAAAVVLLAGVVALVWWAGNERTDSSVPQVANGDPAPGASGARTLILYDTSAFPEGAELYATYTANLASHFGAWTARPVAGYEAGSMSSYDAVVYVGSAYDEPLPAAFLADVAAGATPVVWLRDNIWQLLDHMQQSGQSDGYGFTWKEFDDSQIEEVRYNGTSLTRDADNESGIAQLEVAAPDRVQALATAVRQDGSTLPWAVRSGNLTYLTEIPYTYVSPDDRYLAYADMLFDVLAPDTPERHRGLLRLEDVGPTADPAKLREIADYLHDQEVPFSIALYPVYKDPKGVNNNGEPLTVRLQDRPEVVAALNYMIDRGATLVMHGYTHQYEDLDNPYDGLSGNDYEFFRAHVDENDHVQLDGPVAKDSAKWTRDRIDAAFAEIAAVGLPRPTIFEFPHYAGSVTNYEVVQEQFGIRYDRGQYVPGVLSGTAPTYDQLGGQFVPYLVRDVFGSVVIPENLGQVTMTGYNQHAARPPQSLVETAERNLVVRDGMASFFYHPYLGVEDLRPVVAGIKELGYEFVPVSSITNG